MSLKPDEEFKPELPKIEKYDYSHYHCSQCGGKDYIVINTGIYCRDCRGDKVMIFCTPQICASS